MQSLIVAEVSEAAVPFGDVAGAVAEDLALHLRGRQAGFDSLLLPVDQHHGVPAGPVCTSLARFVGAEVADAFQAFRGRRGFRGQSIKALGIIS